MLKKIEKYSVKAYNKNIEPKSQNNPLSLVVLALFYLKGSEIVENYKKAEKDYMAGMKYKDIAEKYGTTINTVKSWKKRYGWNRKEGAPKKEKVCTQNKNHAAVLKASGNDGTEETLHNDELTPEQQLFCIYYSKTFNATQSYQKAYGCDYCSARAHGYELLRKNAVKTEIDRLKEIKRQQILADEHDIVELQMRIAFSDMGNYVLFEKDKVLLENSHKTDTQLIKKISQGKKGISIELEDRQKAIDWLSKFFELNPSDKHKKEFDMRKLELDLLKLELQAKEPENNQPVEDNFLDALNQVAEEVWKQD